MSVAVTNNITVIILIANIFIIIISIMAKIAMMIVSFTIQVITECTGTNFNLNTVVNDVCLLFNLRLNVMVVVFLVAALHPMCRL